MEGSIRNMSRPQMYLFGCTLKSDRREFKVEVEDDDADHQLSLKAVCLGAEAKGRFHMVEIEGAIDGKTTKVPLAILKPVLPSMSLGGFEITPPVTFRLQSGSGPVHISGQHFVSLKESEDDEEEHNSSPVKRASSLSSGKRPAPKKLKMSHDDDDDDDSDDDDDDEDESDEEAPKVLKSPAKHPKKLFPGLVQTSRGPKARRNRNGSPGKPGGSGLKKENKSAGGAQGRSGAGSSKELSVAEVKNKLASAAKEGKPLPKTEQKFENFANSSFKISDKKVLKDLWSFVQTLKTAKK
ncbi:LOW QUALITY PROTEIN: nucleophosmin 1b [Aplochiton taeniatus]